MLIIQNINITNMKKYDGTEDEKLFAEKVLYFRVSFLQFIF